VRIGDGMAHQRAGLDFENAPRGEERASVGKRPRPQRETRDHAEVAARQRPMASPMRTRCPGWRAGFQSR
jgi:hypothetical protein